MSLKPEPIHPIAQETARIAKAAFPKGSLFMRMRDELGILYQDEAFAVLFPQDGQPALAPWRLALITIMQFAERLPVSFPWFRGVEKDLRYTPPGKRVSKDQKRTTNLHSRIQVRTRVAGPELRKIHNPGGEQDAAFLNQSCGDSLCPPGR